MSEKNRPQKAQLKSKGGICTRAYEMQAADGLQLCLDVRAECQCPDRLRGSIHQSVDLTLNSLEQN